MFSLEGIRGDIAKFMTGCDRLLAELNQQTKFSEIEKVMISHYRKEIIVHTRILRDEIEKR